MKNSNQQGFAAVAVVVALLLTLAAGIAGGFYIKNQSDLTGVKSTPSKLANLTNEQSTDSSKQAGTEQTIQEATPIPTPTFTPTPIPTSTPTPKPTKAPTPTTAPAPAQTQGNGQLSLTATSNESGKVQLNWNFSGTPGSGFKTVYNTAPDPTYPQNTWHYWSDNSKRDDVFEGLPSGQKLYFRVGVYVGGENPVSLYSNNVEVTVK